MEIPPLSEDAARVLAKAQSRPGIVNVLDIAGATVEAAAQCGEGVAALGPQREA